MMTYVKKLIDMKDSASSKIACGLLFVVITVIVIALKIIFNQIPMDVLYFIGGLTLSFFGLSSVDKFAGKDKEIG